MLLYSGLNMLLIEVTKAKDFLYQCKQNKAIKKKKKNQLIIHLN